MSLRDSMVSIAWSEKRCCLPLLLDERGFQDLMKDGDTHRVKEPLLHSFVRIPSNWLLDISS